MLKRYRLKDTNKILKKSRRFKTWMGLVGQILFNMETYLIRGFFQLPLPCPLESNFCKHANGHSVTTEACTSLAWVYVERGSTCSRSSMELSVLFRFARFWYLCSVRLVDLMHTRESYCTSGGISDRLNEITWDNDCESVWKVVYLITDISYLSVMTWHQSESYCAWEVQDFIN